MRRTLPAMAVTLFGFIGLRYLVEDYLRPRYMSPLTSTTLYDPANPAQSFNTNALSQSDQIVSQETINGAGHVIIQNGNLGPNSAQVTVSSNGTVSLSGVGTCSGKVTGPLFQSGPGASQPVGNGVQHVSSGLPSENLNRLVSACARHYNLRELVTYQPMSRYWPFQLYESAIFVGAALVLAGFSLWWVRRGTT